MPVYDPDQPNQGHTMQFTPKTEKQLAEESLLPAGVYDFEVLKAEDAVSKSSGKDMIKLSLRIFHGASERRVTDYLMESMAFKLRHFCQTCGLMDKYDAGTFSAADCEGRAGKVKLKQEIQEGYQPKNSVADYVVAKPTDEVHQPTPAPRSTTPTSGGGASGASDDPPFLYVAAWDRP
jgi:hypothetical protein